MDTVSTRKVAATAAGGIAAIHLVLAPEYLSEELYVGLLFIAGGLASAFVAVKLWYADHIPAWTLGTLIAIGMAAGLVLSRTTGLPGFKEGEWELSGILSLLLEGTFVAAPAVTVRRVHLATRHIAA
jgi:hypothetical protein